MEAITVTATCGWNLIVQWTVQSFNFYLQTLFCFYGSSFSSKADSVSFVDTFFIPPSCHVVTEVESVCPSVPCLSGPSQLFVTKLGIVVCHHEMEYHAEEKEDTQKSLLSRPRSQWGPVLQKHDSIFRTDPSATKLNLMLHHKPTGTF